MDRLGISPLVELGAYELMWLERGARFKSIAEKFAAHPGALPSDFCDRAQALATGREVAELLARRVKRFGVRVHRAGEYPLKLRDAAHPVELIYYRGYWNLVESPVVAVVGTRNPSPEGLRRARKLATMLARADRTVVSGLAAGIDTAAHEAALVAGGRTIAVLGTPLSEVYPAENRELQQRIGDEHLVVSQVPVMRYAKGHPRTNRFFFLERNVTMSALTRATVIVEAGNTSGTHRQARAALQQGRKLFILDSCFLQPELKWPREFENLGAIRVAEFEHILDELGPEANPD